MKLDWWPLFKGQVHAFMAAILLGMSGLEK
jgi:hypothetical protein